MVPGPVLNTVPGAYGLTELVPGAPVNPVIAKGPPVVGLKA